MQQIHLVLPGGATRGPFRAKASLKNKIKCNELLLLFVLKKRKDPATETYRLIYVVKGNTIYQSIKNTGTVPGVEKCKCILDE